MIFLTVDISTHDQEILLKIYIGQNIRKEGILQSEIYGHKQIQKLLSRGLIIEKHWYRNQFLTTDEGSELGKKLAMERIRNKEEELQNMLGDIPPKALGFFVKRHISKELAFSTEKPRWSYTWEDHILADNRIWILWDRLFSILDSLGLCVKTHDYVSTRGGELRDLCYVISPEIRELLVSQNIPHAFTQDQTETLRLFSLLIAALRIIGSNDVDYARQHYYELLKAHSITERQVAGIVNNMSKNEITSEYRGLLSKKKPFDISDSNRFKIYLDKDLIEPAVKMLLGQKGEIKEYVFKEHFPSLSKVKIKGGFLDTKERGEFYILVSDLEWQLREFIKEKLGKGWNKKIENEFPNIVRCWNEKCKMETKWGIEPEKDLMNYADLGDYVQIIKQYSRMFSDADDDLSHIVTNLETWYVHGRNPVMHVRPVDQQKYFTTKSAVKFLLEWMERKR